METIKTYPLNKALKIVIENCYLQVNKHEVLIPYLSGPPGMGKTRTIQKICAERHWCVISIHLAMKPIEELGGIPRFKKITYFGNTINTTVWTLPDIMKELYEKSEEVTKLHDKLYDEGIIKVKNPVVILMLDDIHLAGEDTEPLLFECLTERKIREHALTPITALVLLGNHGLNKAGARTMNAAIMNRVMLMDSHADYDYWKSNFALENVHPSIVSFLGNDNYKKYFHEEELTDLPWASPRTWTGLSTHIKAKEAWERTVSSEDILYMAIGSVGKEAATYFSEYYSIFSKFNIPYILSKGLEYILPTAPLDRYALSYALVSFYIESKEKKKIVNSVSTIIYLFSKKYPDLLLMILNEIKGLNNSTYLFTDILSCLKQIDQTIIPTLLKDFGKFIN